MKNKLQNLIVPAILSLGISLPLLADKNIGLQNYNGCIPQHLFEFVKKYEKYDIIRFLEPYNNNGTYSAITEEQEKIIVDCYKEKGKNPIILRGNPPKK